MIPLGASSELDRDVSVGFFDLDSDRDISLADARALLSQPEADRAARFHFEIHQQRFARGRGMLRRELGKSIGADPKLIDFSYGAHDKPYIEGNPVHFNLSHSHDLGVLAIGAAPLGIDVEFIDRKTDVLELARAVLVPSELEALLDTPAAMQRKVFFSYWTAKEAYMKLIGTGLSLPPKSIELCLRNHPPATVLEPKVPNTRLTVLPPPDDRYFCTLAQLV